MSHKIKFQINEASHGQVWLDGKEINATEISYQAKGGTLAVVTLKLIAEVDGEVEFKELSSASCMRSLQGGNGSNHGAGSDGRG